MTQRDFGRGASERPDGFASPLALDTFCQISQAKNRNVFPGWYKSYFPKDIILYIYYIYIYITYIYILHIYILHISVTYIYIYIYDLSLWWFSIP